jgi:hypothetical protein
MTSNSLPKIVKSKKHGASTENKLPSKCNVKPDSLYVEWFHHFSSINDTQKEQYLLESYNSLL